MKKIFTITAIFVLLILAMSFVNAEVAPGDTGVRVLSTLHLYGGPCDNGTNCTSGICLDNNTCGCNNDTDCANNEYCDAYLCFELNPAVTTDLVTYMHGMNVRITASGLRTSGLATLDIRYSNNTSVPAYPKTNVPLYPMGGFVRLWYTDNETFGNYTVIVTDQTNTSLTANTTFELANVTVLYCGDNICNNNETCSTCPEDCGNCTYNGGGGGGGGGSSKTETQIISPPVLPAYQMQTRIADELEGSAGRTKSGKNFEIKITPIEKDICDNFGTGDPNKIKYACIDATPSIDLTNEEIQWARIEYSINQSWISGESINEEQIGLVKQTDSGYLYLSGIEIGSNLDYVYYESFTPNFSTFVIYGERKTTMLQLEWLVMTLFIILAASLLIFISKKMKRKTKKSKKKQ